MNIIQYELNIVGARSTREVEKSVSTMNEQGDLQNWISVLDEEDMQFLKRFLLASGSLKALAREYGISYPTVRARLDRLIAKVKAAESPEAKDAFHRQLQILVADGVLGTSAARKLLAAHDQVVKPSKGKDHENYT